MITSVKKKEKKERKKEGREIKEKENLNLSVFLSV
jgi:hypothetical protein